jgi:aryl-alcohol dehydrogenase-like predicted oxidoreductase
MLYRALGKTGLKVSELTFGAHGVDHAPLMRSAIDAGINTFFTSGDYLDGREEVSLGKAIRAIGVRRDDLVIVTGNTVRPGTPKNRILDSIDGCLRRLGTDRVDVYAISDVCSPADIRVDAWYEAFEEAKRAGKVGHMALSGHCGGMQACLNAAIEDGRFEVFLFKYDFVSYPDQAEILRRAAERGIGAIVFKVNAGNRAGEIKDLERGGLSFRQATVKWALGNPDISSVAATITNFDQIQELTAAVGADLSKAEADMLRRYRDAMADQYCRFCRTCETRCPQGVAVADVMRYAMYFKYYGREKEAMRRYRALPDGRSASACAQCAGPCDAGCPFGRQTREGLVEAHRLLDLAPV